MLRTDQQTEDDVLLRSTDEEILLLVPDLDGQLLVAGTAEHERARSQNFALNAHDDDNNDNDSSGHVRIPSYIAIVKSIQDVQTCVKFATQHQLIVSIRTGGHNWFGCYLKCCGGSSARRTMLLDLHQLDFMGDIDDTTRTITVGPAALGQDLNRHAASLHNLCLSSGHCVGVSLGGYLLGSGLGWFAPYYGYASESIVGMSIVDAHGNLLEVTDNDDADNDGWMWLARGSACAFPGVVVAFTLQLHPLAPLIRTKASFHPLEDYESILLHIYQFVTTRPQFASKTEVALVLTETPPHLTEAIQGPFVALLKISVMADTHDELDAILGALTGENGDRFPSVPIGGGGDNESEWERHESFESLPETTRLAYPPNHHWMCRSYLSDLDRFDTMDWSEFRQTFVTNAPVSNPTTANTTIASTLVHTTVIVAPERPVSVPGCYGRCTPGITVLVSGAYSYQLCPSVDSKSDVSTTPNAEVSMSDVHSTTKSNMQQYVDAMHSVLDSFATRYDVVEHPVHRDTFERCYPSGTAQRIRSLRAALDPDKLFWDPSDAEPYP